MSTDNKTTTVDNVTIDSIDDFLPMPGAESIVTSTNDSEEEKPGIFSPSGKTVDMGFLEDNKSSDDPEKQSTKVDTEKTLAELDSDLEKAIDDEESGKPGRKRVDKSGLVDTFGKLIEEGMIVPFEDDKPLEEYSLKDWKELLQANFEEREKSIREQTPKEFFESLPEELQYAAEYVARGGQCVVGILQMKDTKNTLFVNTYKQLTLVMVMQI
jgi:hypothetical protein